MDAVSEDLSDVCDVFFIIFPIMVVVFDLGVCRHFIVRNVGVELLLGVPTHFGKLSRR